MHREERDRGLQHILRRVQLDHPLPPALAVEEQRGRLKGEDGAHLAQRTRSRLR